MQLVSRNDCESCMNDDPIKKECALDEIKLKKLPTDPGLYERGYWFQCLSKKEFTKKYKEKLANLDTDMC